MEAPSHVRAELVYERWHWPDNYSWSPDNNHSTSPEEKAAHTACPLRVSFSTLAGALDAWERYAAFLASVGPPRLALVASTHSLPDWDARGRFRHEELHTEWELVGPLGFTRHEEGVKFVANVRSRTIGRRKGTERNAEGWTREVVDTEVLTDWSEPRDRGWACVPAHETVRSLWGDTPPLLLRSAVEAARDAARVERWAQGKMALDSVLGTREPEWKPKLCPDCAGYGVVDGAHCTTCNGTGEPGRFT